jgi:hypothetical protein
MNGQSGKYEGTVTELVWPITKSLEAPDFEDIYKFLTANPEILGSILGAAKFSA